MGSLEVKLLEIRDRGTFIPCMGILVCRNDGQLLWRAGFGDTPLVILINLSTMECSYDPYGWRTRARTMPNAHAYIQANWGNIAAGDVIDVEFILGETTVRKVSEV